MKNGTPNPFFNIKQQKYVLMAYGQSQTDIANMSPEDIEMFLEFEKLWREMNTIAIANAVGKALGGTK